MKLIGIKILEALEELEPSVRRVIIKILKELEKAINESVRREDFRELSNIVKELAEAQKRTEQRVEELAEAQKELKKELKELAEAQKRTEQRVEELAEAQKKTEEQLIKLTAEHHNLVLEHRKTREHLGGLANSFGYHLENEAYKYLPKLLKKDYGLELLGRLDRGFVEYPNNRYDEINILGRAKRNGKEIYIIGEAKIQLSRRHISEFLEKVKRIKQYKNWDVFLVMVTHMPVNPQVVPYAQTKDIVIYKSSDFIEV